MQSRKLLDAARGQSCALCGNDDGTVVAAHYSGLYSSALGKGMGQKAWDFCAAHLCHRCHSDLDGYSGGNNEERAVRFMVAIFKTQKRLFDAGVLKCG
jgi:Protein of unknown function (DUF1364)